MPEAMPHRHSPDLPLCTSRKCLREATHKDFHCRMIRDLGDTHCYDLNGDFKCRSQSEGKQALQKNLPATGTPSMNQEHLHYQDLSVTNFRGLQQVTFPELARVNLITGRNNSGKSSLLEAIRIQAANGVTDTLHDILVEREEYSEPARSG